MTIKKRYIDIKDPKKLKIEVYYSRDGILLTSGKRYPRGYYLSILSVEHKTTPSGSFEESFMLGSGGKRFLIACNAPNNTIAQEAIRLADAVEKELIDAVCRHERIKLPSTEKNKKSS